MRSRGKRVAAIVVLLAAAIIVAAIWYRESHMPLEAYRTFDSPDGQYRVEIWRQPQGSMMPGQSGDAPGVARLVDRSGKTLGEAPLEMVQLADAVDWSGGHASIKLVVDWDLAVLSKGQ